MNCPNCKKEINDDSKFCIFCGTNVQAAQPKAEENSNRQAQFAQPVQNQQNTEPQQNNTVPQANNAGPQPNFQTQNYTQQNMNYAPAMQPKKPKNKKMLIGIIGGACALVAIIVVAAVLVVNHKTKINLNDYINIEYDGYDTYGRASIDFDSDKYFEDLQKASSSFKKVYMSEGANNLLSYYYDMIDSLDYSLDKNSELSNGDTVTVSFEFDNEAAAKFKIEYVGEPTEYTVEGLKEVKKIDPFDGIRVDFTGTSPNISAEVVKTKTDDVYSNIYFDLSKSYGIKVGDTVTVTVSNNPEYFVEDYGYAFTATSKDYTCSNVDKYIDKAADISDDTMSTMKKQTEDVINSYFASDSKYIGVSDLKFEGTYFLTEKVDNSWSFNGTNQVYVIYSGKVKSNEEKKQFDETTVYFPVRYADIIEYADGTQYVDTKYASIEGETTLKYSYFSSVKGYTDKSAMYNDLVVAQKADYNEEITEGLK